MWGNFKNRFVGLEYILPAFDDLTVSLEFLTNLLNTLVFVIDQFVLILPELEHLLEFLVKGLLDPDDHVLHHDDLVAFGVVGEQFKGVVE